MKQRNASVCLLLILCNGLLCCAQITAADQQKINTIQGWVQEQLKQGMQPTQEQMDSINKAVSPPPAIQKGGSNQHTSHTAGGQHGWQSPSLWEGWGWAFCYHQAMHGWRLTQRSRK